MPSSSFNLEILQSFVLVAPFLGILGSLYLIYDFCSRPKVLHRLVWAVSSSYIFSAVLIISCFFFIGSNQFFTQPLSPIRWRLIGIFICAALILQFIYSPSISSRFMCIDRTRLLLALVESSIGLLALVKIIAPRDSSLFTIIIFAVPGILIFAILNGFSPAIQWWILRLPEKCVAAIGALLLLCAFALMSVQPLLSFLGISLQ